MLDAPADCIVEIQTHTSIMARWRSKSGAGGGSGRLRRQSALVPPNSVEGTNK